MSCSKDNQISFCEGTDLNGKGVKCGKKFYSGDMTGIINYKKPFESDKINIIISKTSGNSSMKVDSFTLDVKENEEKAVFNLPMYNEGAFTIDAVLKGKKISTGTLTIVE